MKIYGNEHLISTFQNMLRTGRMAHSFLIYGEKGLGKKMVAGYLAQLLVCENEEKPCGRCRACINAGNNTHPDIIYAEHSGKLGGFSVDTIRNISTDAYIHPNNSNVKIYIFTDADNITVQAQNSLLKLIEEPPSYAYFIFTAHSKSVFLETIISRAVSLSVSQTDISTALTALNDYGVTEEQANDAVGCFGGNIGMCLDYINQDELKNAVQLTKRITDCIINRDEYSLLYALTEAASEKAFLKNILSMLDRIIRDSLALKYQEESFIDCYRGGALKLSETLTVWSCGNLHRCVTDSYKLIDRNVNLKLVVSSLCGGIMNCR